MTADLVYVVAGGALLLAARPTVFAVGGGFRGLGPVGTVVLVLLAVAPSALVLSTVTPGVIKLRLRTLAETGETVGRPRQHRRRTGITGMPGRDGGRTDRHSISRRSFRGPAQRDGRGHDGCEPAVTRSATAARGSPLVTSPSPTRTASAPAPA